ncbi:hypothetical protein Q3304_08405 [Clostridioides sp. GD02377]|uniref:hypothetical protein n=1 Tax=unclassified Clostridioides TaxID=2635829 RepID=UPI0038AB01C7
MEMKDLKVKTEVIETPGSQEERLKVDAGIVIDLGNSESRFRVIHENKAISHTIIKRNEFAKLSKKYTIPSRYLNENSTILKIDAAYVDDIFIENEEDEEDKKTRLIANGIIVEREFMNRSVRPTALNTKTSQKVTFWTLRLAFQEAIIYLADYYKKKPEDIDFTFDVGVLLPPVEEEMYGLEMCEKIKEIKHIETTVPYALKKEFTINKVFTLAEGIASFMGVMYKVDNKGELVLNEKNKRFEKGYVIIIDIGSGTTDALVILNSELVERSRNTFELGGNTILALLDKDIQSEYKHVLTEREKEELLKTGTFIIGDGKKINFIEEINEGKEYYSDMLQKKIITMLEGLNISLMSIKGILVCGGGALPIKESIVKNGTPEERVISPSMSDVLRKYFHDLNPELSDVSLDDLNPRLTNLLGIEYIYKFGL